MKSHVKAAENATYYATTIVVRVLEGESKLGPLPFPQSPTIERHVFPSRYNGECCIADFLMQCHKEGKQVLSVERTFTHEKANAND